MTICFSLQKKTYNSGTKITHLNLTGTIAFAIPPEMGRPCKRFRRLQGAQAQQTRPCLCVGTFKNNRTDGDPQLQQPPRYLITQFAPPAQPMASSFQSTYQSNSLKFQQSEKSAPPKLACFEKNCIFKFATASGGYRSVFNAYGFFSSLSSHSRNCTRSATTSIVSIILLIPFNSYEQYSSGLQESAVSNLIFISFHKNKN